MARHGRVKSIETKAKQKLQSTKYNAKRDAKNIAKYNANNNAKNNAKRAPELHETKKTENDALVAQGIGVDAALRPDAIETIALMVVKQIENIVDEDGKVYVFTSAERRIDVESFASVTVRGNGTPLISDKNGDNVTAKIMKDTYKWKCKKSQSKCTSSCLRTKCQSGSGTELEVSDWTRRRTCSNSHSQLFTDPVRASVLPPRIHANCLTEEKILIYDDDILCFHPAAQPEDRTST